MKLRLALGKCQCPELDITVHILDNRIQRDLGRQGQIGCDSRFQREFAISVRTSDGNRIDRPITAVQPDIIEVVAGPAGRRAEVEFSIPAAFPRYT